MFCQKCGAEIPVGENLCPNCGALRDGMKFCQHCGQPIDKECVVCPKCGKQVSELKQYQPQVVINNSNNNENSNINHMASRCGWTKSTIVISRKASILGCAKKYKIFLDNQFIGLLINGETVTIESNSGFHKLELVGFKKVEASLDLHIPENQNTTKLFTKMNLWTSKIEIFKR